jgi:hypothetical protein
MLPGAVDVCGNCAENNVEESRTSNNEEEPSMSTGVRIVRRVRRWVRFLIDPSRDVEEQRETFCPCGCGWITDMCDCPVFCHCSCRVPAESVTT